MVSTPTSLLLLTLLVLVLCFTAEPVSARTCSEFTLTKYCDKLKDQGLTSDNSAERPEIYRHSIEKRENMRKAFARFLTYGPVGNDKTSVWFLDFFASTGFHYGVQAERLEFGSALIAAQECCLNPAVDCHVVGAELDGSNLLKLQTSFNIYEELTASNVQFYTERNALDIVAALKTTSDPPSAIFFNVDPFSYSDSKPILQEIAEALKPLCGDVDTICAGFVNCFAPNNKRAECLGLYTSGDVLKNREASFEIINTNANIATSYFLSDAPDDIHDLFKGDLADTHAGSYGAKNCAKPPARRNRRRGRWQKKLTS